MHEVLIDKALIGWKEYELELLRDKNDNVVIICTIENMDPMGIHTGDSITVAPAISCISLTEMLAECRAGTTRMFAGPVSRENG